MKNIHLFLTFSLLLSACGMQPTALPATTEPAAAPTTFSKRTVVPPAPTPTAMPTFTNTPEPTEPCSPPGQLTNDFLIIGYLPEYRQLNPDWGKCLTDLIYFSIQPLPDGGLDTSALSVEILQMLRDMRRTNGLRIHISVGGWKRSDSFSAMATRPKTRKTFVR